MRTQLRVVVRADGDPPTYPADLENDEATFLLGVLCGTMISLGLDPGHMPTDLRAARASAPLYRLKGKLEKVRRQTEQVPAVTA